MARASHAILPRYLFQRPWSSCASAHRWLITMSATGVSPTAFMVLMHARSSSSEPYNEFRLYRSVGRYPCVLTDAVGGGSHTAVNPAFPMAATSSLRTLNHFLVDLHDSQLNPCRMISRPLPQGVLGRLEKGISGTTSLGSTAASTPSADAAWGGAASTAGAWWVPPDCGGYNVAGYSFGSSNCCGLGIWMPGGGASALADACCARKRSRCASTASIAVMRRSSTTRASMRDDSMTSHSLLNSAVGSALNSHDSTSLALARSMVTTSAAAAASSAAASSSCSAMNTGSALAITTRLSTASSTRARMAVASNDDAMP
mmetsp:Transcript_5942/g.15113  ORF Transcript_5942/g.15113 Transcript_5942/m.15113 type:complete len:316 (+) Transcript_5942:1162-2109(+)